MKVTGQGTIFPLEEGKGKNCRRWRLQVSLGLDPTTGKYRKASRTVHGTKTEAKEELRKFRLELQSMSTLDAASLTLGAYAEQWLEERRNAAQPPRAGTLRNNTIAVRTIQKGIGEVLLKDLGPQEIARFYAAMKTGEASLSGRPLTGTTAHKIATTLSAMLSKAVRRGLIPSNPCDRLEREDKPQPDTEEKEPLSSKDVARLVANLYDGRPDAHRMGAALCLELGLRREEALGLSWKDVDLDRGLLHVCCAYTADEMSLQKTKSAKSDRYLPLGGPLRARLAQWKEVQRSTLSPLGILQSPMTPVLTSRVGTRFEPNNFSRWWTMYCRRLGIRQVGLHMLRHVFASNLAKQGAGPREIQELLGDSTLDVAMKVYVHASEERKRRAMNDMSRLLHGSPEGPLDCSEE